jgi:nicotinamide riboside transporter PnuC
MTSLQAFIIVMGLVGQVLIARRDVRGYVAWIAGNVALMFIYYETHQLALIGLQVVNSAIQVNALRLWMQESHAARLRQRGT